MSYYTAEHSISNWGKTEEGDRLLVIRAVKKKKGWG